MATQEDKSKLQFTPGQVAEALEWYKINAPNLVPKVELSVETNFYPLDFNLVDIYHKLKDYPFIHKPNEFIVGIEYNSKEAIETGKEAPNVYIHNPHKIVNDNYTHDEFSMTILYSLFSQLKAP